MSKRKHSVNSDESHKFLIEGPSCSSQFDYLQYNQNGTNTSANKQDLVNNHNLFRNPEIYKSDQQETGDLQNESKSLANNWTDQYWLKQDDIPASTQKSHSRKGKVKKPKNSIEKTLNKMLAQPAEMSKGKSLLVKMGWKGGGLGKDEDGIVDPIAPKATYANQTIGLGLLAENKNGRNHKPCRKKERKTEKHVLENMGWKGGALVKEGDGIVDPIALAATHTTQSIGLDQTILLATLLESESGHKQNGSWKKKDKKKIKKQNNISEEQQLTQGELHFKNHIRTKILLRILEFVKNNSKTELQFEKLSRTVRKSIHHLVESVQECDNPELLDLNDDTDKEIVGQILLYNNYILKTQSNGVAAKRRLCLYKEVPENVYLITPDYLREDIEGNKTDLKNDFTTAIVRNNVTTTTNEKEVATDEENKIQTNDANEPIDKTENDSCDISKAENEGNDLKVNIDNKLDLNKVTDIVSGINNKKQDGANENELNSEIKNDKYKQKEKCLEKIIEYFREFVDDFVYKEFRFLGDFNNDERDAIKLFFDICFKMPVECEGKSELVQILTNVAHTFNIEEDNNGNLVIKKLQN